jgi:hypothetical protein
MSLSIFLKRSSGAIRTRAIKVISEVVPYNYSKYKPAGYIDSSTFLDVYDGIEATWHEAIVNELTISKGLYNATVDFMRLEDFDEESGKISSEIDVGAVSVLDGRVYTNSPERVIPFDRNNKVITDVLFHHRLGNFNENYSLNIKYFPKPTLIEGTAVSLLAGGGAGSNIAHWMLDVIPRLEQVRKLFPLDKVDKLIVPGKEMAFKTESLTGLGVDRNKLIFVTSQLAHFKASRMLFATPPRSHDKVLVPEWLVKFHRQFFLDTPLSPKNNYPKKIYISRKDSNLRALGNEHEVCQLLKKRGFSEVVFSEYSYTEKVQLANNAEEIISMSGAGLTFLLFCRPGTKVLEIFPRSFVHYVNYSIAMQCRLNYRYIVFGNSKSNKSARAAQRNSVIVDTEQLEKILDDF